MIDFGTIEDHGYGGKYFGQPCPYCGERIADDEDEIRRHANEVTAYTRGYERASAELAAPAPDLSHGKTEKGEG